MTLAESAAELVNSIVAMPGEFAGVAMHDPLSAVLVAIGGLLTFAAVGAFGYLALGGVVAFLSAETSRAPPQEVR